MKNEAAFLLAESGRVDAWDQEEKSSYDAAALDTEYRDRLYSEEGLALLALLDCLEQESTPVVYAGTR
jgi:hypothetical protein